MPSDQTFTLLTSMIGASLLSCSFIVSQIGIIQAIFLFIFTIFCQIILMWWFTESCFYCQATSYVDLASKLQGKHTANILRVSIILSKVGNLISYIIIVAQSVFGLLQTFVEVTNMHYIVIKVVCTLILMFPLSFFKSLTQLSKLLVLTSLIILLVTISVMGFYFTKLGSGKEMCGFKFETVWVPTDISILNQVLNFIKYVPSMLSNYSTHAVIPCLLSELQGDKHYVKKQTQIANAISATLASVVYIGVGFCGSLMFGGQIQSNIFTNFGCNIYMQILHVGYGLVVVIAFPLVIFPVRTGIQSVFKHPYCDNNTSKGYLIHILINFIVTIVCLLVACFMDDIVVIFSFISAVTGFMCLYFVPILTILKMPQSKIHYDHMFSKRKIQNHDVLGVPIFMMFFGNVSQGRNILGIVNKYQSQQNQVKLKTNVKMRMITIEKDENSNTSQDEASSMLHHEDTDVEELVSKVKLAKYSLVRSVMCGVLVAISAVVCGVGAVVCFLDLIQSFR